MVGDQVRRWRVANLERIAIKWDAVRKARGMSKSTIKTLPFGDACQIIEAASMEENGSVQDFWANLIATATDKSQTVTIKKVFVDLLKSLGRADAVLLDCVFDFASTVPVRLDRRMSAEARKFILRTKQKVKGLAGPNALCALHNLIRLRLIGMVITFPDVFGTVGKTTSIQEHVRRMKPEKVAESLIAICHKLNLLSGWENEECLHDATAFDIALYAVNECSLTTLGFALLNTCQGE